MGFPYHSPLILHGPFHLKSFICSFIHPFIYWKFNTFISLKSHPFIFPSLSFRDYLYTATSTSAFHYPFSTSLHFPSSFWEMNSSLPMFSRAPYCVSSAILSYLSCSLFQLRYISFVIWPFGSFLFVCFHTANIIPYLFLVCLSG